MDRLVEHLPQPQAITEQELQNLTPERAKLLFFLSFRLSQGDQDLQYSIFEWIHRKHPSWRIVAKNLEQDSVARNEHFLLTNPGTRHSATGTRRRDINPQIVRVTTSSELSLMQLIFDKGRGIDLGLNHKDYALKLAGLILQEDAKRLLPIEGKPATGRARQGEYIPGKPETDPWSSQFVDYGMRKHAIGVPEYDEMFAEIIRAVEDEIGRNKKWKESESLKNLPAIIQSYNSHHREQKVRIPRAIKK